MRHRFRSARGVAAVVATALLAACGPDASSSPSPVSTTSDVSATNVRAADFGSAYIGQPVAFWFWAPY